MPLGVCLQILEGDTASFSLVFILYSRAAVLAGMAAGGFTSLLVDNGRHLECGIGCVALYFGPEFWMSTQVWNVRI